MAGAAAGPPGAGRGGRERLVAFSGVMLATLLAALDQTIVATSLPAIVGDLEGFDDLSWVVTAYLVGATVTVTIFGKLSDIYGRRPMFVVAISTFVVGSVLCGIAQSMGQLIAFRAIQGLAAGGLIPLGHAAVADLFPPRERGRYQGYVGAMWALASVAGPLVGGTLTDAATWRLIFLINVPLGALALVVVLRTMPKMERTRPHSIDVAGAAILSVAITGLLLATAWGGQDGEWTSARVLGGAALGVVGTVLFIRQERRAREPLLPLALFSRSIFTVSTIANVLIGAVLFSMTIYIPVFAQGALDSSATASGAVILPLSMAWVIAAIASGQLIARTGRYKVFPVAGSVLVAVGLLLLTALDVASSGLDIAIATTVIGLGMGLMVQTYILATQNAVPPGDIGIATGTLQFFRNIGGSVAVAGFGALLVHRVSVELTERLGAAAERVDVDRLLRGDAGVPSSMADATHESLAAGLHTVFVLSVPLGVAMVACALALRERPLRAHDAPAATTA